MNASCRLRRALACSAAALVLAATGAAQIPSDSWSAYMASGAAQESRQQLDVAAEYYARALGAARTPAEQVEAALARASLLARGSSLDPTRLREVQSLYSTAMDEATGDLRLRAYNDYGVFLLRHGRAAMAAEVLGRVERLAKPTSSLSAVVRSRYFFNYAQALEQSGREQEASDRYLESIRLDATFGPARVAALRLAQKPVPADPEPILEVFSPPASAEARVTPAPNPGQDFLMSIAPRPTDLRASVSHFQKKPAHTPGETAAKALWSNARSAAAPSSPGRKVASDRMLQVLETLLAQGDLVNAEATLRLLLAGGVQLATTHHERLLDLLVRYLTAARIGPGDFDRSWRSTLEIVEKTLPSSPLAFRLGEIRKAYLDELPIEIRPQATAVFPSWGFSGQAEPFSDLVKMIGDSYAASGERHRALERYVQASLLDPGNAEASLYLVNLLSEYSQELDPKDVLFDQLAEMLPTSDDRIRPRDWSNVLRLHFLMGTVLERRARWGPDESPRGAIFHWQQALAAERHLALASNAPPPVPLLHEKLGGAYRAVGEVQAAVQQYLEGADEYRALNDPQRARTLVAQAAEIGAPKVSPADDRTPASQDQIAATTTYSSTTATTDTTTGMTRSAYAGHLPATASTLPWLGMTGLGALGAALCLRRLRQKETRRRATAAS